MRRSTKTIEQLFAKNEKANPNWSSYLCLAEVVKYRPFTYGEVKRAFNKLVSKEDYETTEKESIVDFLFSLTKLERKKNKLQVKQAGK